MPKILYIITQAEFGGAQRYIFDLTDNLKSEYQISVAFAIDGAEEGLGGKLKEKNIPYFTIPHLKREISPLNDVIAIFEIAKLIKKIKPDIIHLNSSKISILGSFASFLYKLSTFNFFAKGGRLLVIYTAHGWVFNEPMSAMKKTFYKYAEKFTARFKDRIICVSEFDRLTGIKEKIAPPKKLITIHNGLKPIAFLPREEAKKILNRKIQNTNSQFLLGAVGNLYKTKGYAYFVEAINILVNKKHLPLAAIIAGEGEERAVLEKLIEKYKLENNFFLAGHIDNASSLLKALDIYVMSSVKEGFPYAILEAMSAGLPIVTTRVGGIPEMIENEKNGILIDFKDPIKLAEGIEKIIKNKEFGEKITEAARKKCLEEFTIEKMTNKTKAVYRA